ncbi:orotidine-5'-phosphate decarboxylase [bacterium]|nr:orotidine-5'-phosphate decarboxylase [bacterium]
MNFNTRLESVVKGGIGLCVGLDPVMDKLPEHVRSSAEPLLAFNLEIIEYTHEYAAAYKPNLAFYEAHGLAGWRQLEKTIRAIPEECLIIADGKRGDIGSTAEAYAVSLFETLNCDAATVNPYLGSDALEPFLQREDKGAFILAVTSNPGGADLQDLVCDDEQLFRHVIRMARRLNKLSNVGLVVGATKPDLWHDLLELAEDLSLLIPGIGAQGGDLDAMKRELKDYGTPALVNASRSILYASSGVDFGQAAGDAARRLRDQLVE